MHRLALSDDPLALVDEGGGLRVDQGLQRRWAPVVVGDLVVGAGQRVNTAVDDLDELLDRLLVGLRLPAIGRRSRASGRETSILIKKKRYQITKLSSN